MGIMRSKEVSRVLLREKGRSEVVIARKSFVPTWQSRTYADKAVTEGFMNYGCGIAASPEYGLFAMTYIGTSAIHFCSDN